MWRVIGVLLAFSLVVAQEQPDPALMNVRYLVNAGDRVEDFQLVGSYVSSRMKSGAVIDYIRREASGVFVVVILSSNEHRYESGSTTLFERNHHCTAQISTRGVDILSSASPLFEWEKP